MAVAFVVTTAETDLVQALFPDAEYPCADGALFRFRNMDVNPTLGVLTAFAAEADRGSEEQRAALRLAERLGTWIGRNHVADQKAFTVADLPADLTDTLEEGLAELVVQEEAPSPAPKRRRKASAEQEAPVADETVED